MTQDSVFNNILKKKIREEFRQELPEKYWSLIDGVENPTDDREVISKLALDAGIPVIMSEIEKRGRKSYEIGVLWNEMPKLVGITGTAKQIRDKASDWKKDSWVSEEKVISKKEWTVSNAGLQPRVQFYIPEGYTGRITGASNFLNIDAIPKLLVNLQRNKYNTIVIEEWLNALTKVTRELPMLALETHNELKDTQLKLLQIPSSSQSEADKRAREKIAPTLFHSKPDRKEFAGYIYAFASESDLISFKVKLGRCNKPKVRNTAQNNSHADNVDYLICLPVHDAFLAEKILHRTLQQCKYLWYNREFYYLTKDRAIDIVKKVSNILTSMLTDIYQPAVEDAKELYINDKIQITNKEDNMSEEDSDEESPSESIKKAVEILLRNKNYALLTEDKFKRLLESHFKTAFEDALKTIREEQIFDVNQTKNRWKISAINN